MAKKSTMHSSWGLTLVGVLGAALGTAVTGVFSYVTQTRDIDAKMLELSTAILQGPATRGTWGLREWSVNTLVERGNAKLSETQKKALIRGEWPLDQSKAAEPEEISKK